MIDLHRHLGGSIKPSVVWDIIKSQPQLRNLASSLEDVESQMTYKNDDKTNLSFHKFLQKLHILNYIRWKEDDIDKVINNAIKDLSIENISLCELRFSIDKYLNHLPWDEIEVTLFVLDRIKYWAKIHNVKVSPILCVKHEAPKINSKRISKLIHHWKVAEEVAGIDFVGAESHFDNKFLMDCFRYWKLCGKGLLLHAGETQGAENVRFAIEKLKVNRIAHGITAADGENNLILQMAKINNIAFDIALTSNFYTGVVPMAEEVPYHPVVKMLLKGCAVTIGTDDPATFGITLESEYELLAKILRKHTDMVEEEVQNTILEVKQNSINYAIQNK